MQVQTTPLQDAILAVLAMSNTPMTPLDFARGLPAIDKSETDSLWKALNDMVDSGLLYGGRAPTFTYDLAEAGRKRILTLTQSPDVELITAAEAIQCPDCGHPLKEHLGADGCERELGDRQVQEIGAVAAGLCGCKLQDSPDLVSVVETLRKVGRQ